MPWLTWRPPHPARPSRQTIFALIFSSHAPDVLAHSRKSGSVKGGWSGDMGFTGMVYHVASSYRRINNAFLWSGFYSDGNILPHPITGRWLFRIFLGGGGVRSWCSLRHCSLSSGAADSAYVLALTIIRDAYSLLRALCQKGSDAVCPAKSPLVNAVMRT
jgi:hypothetical protein